MKIILSLLIIGVIAVSVFEVSYTSVKAATEKHKANMEIVLGK